LHYASHDGDALNGGFLFNAQLKPPKILCMLPISNFQVLDL